MEICKTILVIFICLYQVDKYVHTIKASDMKNI